jgi:hypothetical protein
MVKIRVFSAGLTNLEDIYTREWMTQMLVVVVIFPNHAMHMAHRGVEVERGGNIKRLLQNHCSFALENWIIRELEKDAQANLGKFVILCQSPFRDSFQKKPHRE